MPLRATALRERVLLATLLLALVAVAAGFYIFTERGRSTGEHYVIRAATLQNGISTLDLIDYLGITERQGYPLTVLRLPRTPDIMSALADGRVDIAVLPAEAAGKLLEENTNVKIFAVDMLQNQAVLVRDTGITSIEDLKGKLVGAVLTSGTYKMFKAYVKLVYGIDLVESREPVPDAIAVLDIPPDRILDALEEGRAAAIVVWEPLVSIGLARGYKILATFQDLWGDTGLEGQPVMLVWVASTEFINEHRDAFNKIKEARCEAAALWLSNKSLTLQALENIYKLPRPVLESIYERVVIVREGLTGQLINSINKVWWLAWKGGYLTVNPSILAGRAFLEMSTATCP